MIINRIILIVLMFGTAFLSGVYGGTITYTLFYLTWGLPALSALYLLYVFVRFKIYQSVEKVVLVKGEKVPFRFVLANEDIITYAGVNVTFFDRLSSISDLPTEKNYSLMPGQSYEWDTTICAKYKGEYSVGVEKAEITDFLHLFKLTFRYPKTILIRVLPRIPYYENLIVASEKYLDNSYSVGRNEENFPDVELRKFVAGDSIRAVNWKASARVGELFTRKYIDESNPEVYLLTDFSSSKLTGESKIILEDKIVEASLGIAYYLYQQHVTVNAGFCSAGVQKLSIFSKQGIDAFYEVCAATPFVAELDVKQLILGVPGITEGMMQVIIVTHTLSDRLLVQCGELADKGQPVDIVYIGDDDLKDRLNVGDKFRVTQITSEQEVGDVLNRKV